MKLEEIRKELVQFNVTDAAIAELGDRYLKLTVKGIDDKEGLEIVHTARMDVKTRRVAVEKQAKLLKEDAILFQKNVNAEQKRILNLLEPIESHLEAEEDRIAAAKEAVKEAEAAHKRGVIQGRANALFALGCKFDGMTAIYTYGTIIIPQSFIEGCNDEEFNKRALQIRAIVDQEIEERDAETRRRTEEDKRLQAIAAEQQAERQRLEEQHQKLRAAEAAVQAEKDAIEREKKRVADEIEAKRLAEVRAEEERIMQARAAEQARIETEARIKRELEEKAAKMEKARIQAERKAARLPDKEKLAAFTAGFMDRNPLPDMKTPDGISAKAEIGAALTEVANKIDSIIAKL
jgi:hypothetical protein